jgi:hypothetical protein
MSIAIDQSRLRQISDSILGRSKLDRDEVDAIMELAQLAATVDDDESFAEHETLQAIAQHVGAMAGWEPGEMRAVHGSAMIGEKYVESLSRRLSTQASRELAYAYAFLVSVSNLELTARERAELERFQRALGVSDRRATDLVVRITEVVAADDDR